MTRQFLIWETGAVFISQSWTIFHLGLDALACVIHETRLHNLITDRMLVQLLIACLFLQPTQSYWELNLLSYTQLPTSINRGTPVYGGINLGTATEAAYDPVNSIVYIIGMSVPVSVCFPERDGFHKTLNRKLPTTAAKQSNWIVDRSLWIDRCIDISKK